MLLEKFFREMLNRMPCDGGIGGREKNIRRRRWLCIICVILLYGLFYASYRNSLSILQYGKEQEAKVIENNNENKRRSIRLEREPSESTLPDYSYDNPTLSVSHSPINTV